MQKAFFMMLLAVASSNAAAGWLETSKSNVGISYIDPSSIRRNGDKVKVAMLIDLNSGAIFDGKAYLSLLIINEYDCAKGQMRKISGVAYSENMGKGGVIYNEPESSNWNQVVPGLEMGNNWHYACGKQ